MIKPTKSQHIQTGFGAVEAILMIVIIGILGFAGWYVYHATKNTDKTYNSASVSSNSSPKPAKSVKATSSGAIQPVAAVNYFTLTQWHVRAAYSGALTLQYSPNSSNAADMDVSSTQLNAGGPSICTTAAGAAGYIGRYLPTDDIPTEGPPAETAQAYVSQDFAASNSTPPAYAKVGGYYYIYFTGQSNSCSDTTTLTQTQAAFSALVPKLVAY